MSQLGSNALLEGMVNSPGRRKAEKLRQQAAQIMILSSLWRSVTSTL